MTELELANARKLAQKAYDDRKPSVTVSPSFMLSLIERAEADRLRVLSEFGGKCPDLVSRVS